MLLKWKIYCRTARRRVAGDGSYFWAAYKLSAAVNKASKDCWRHPLHACAWSASVRALGAGLVWSRRCLFIRVGLLLLHPGCMSMLACALLAQKNVVDSIHPVTFFLQSPITRTANTRDDFDTAETQHRRKPFITAEKRGAAFADAQQKPGTSPQWFTDTYVAKQDFPSWYVSVCIYQRLHVPNHIPSTCTVQHAPCEHISRTGGDFCREDGAWAIAAHGGAGAISDTASIPARYT
jgi:hypothetical protein